MQFGGFVFSALPETNSVFFERKLRPFLFICASKFSFLGNLLKKGG